jgi:murein DD-endopeptidase MepM/ murein hydrolase activator NlpD
MPSANHGGGARARALRGRLGSRHVRTSERHYARPTWPRSAAAIGILASIFATISLPGAGASNSVGVDRMKIRALEALIAEEGSKVQGLVAAYDVVDGRLTGLDAAIKTDEARLKVESAAQARASSKLRSAAVDAYINASAGNSSSLGTFFDSASASSLPTRETYLGIASGTLNSAVETFVQDQYATSQTAEVLKGKQATTLATLHALANSRDQVQAAIDSDEQTLNGLNSNELELIDRANAARAAAAAQAAERVLAVEAAQQAAPPPTNTSVVVGSAGQYANPLRAVRGLSPNRIDQGVDYDGFGPVYALGDGEVLSVVNGGWPGGTFICYRLTDGPASGLVVYVAEDLNPNVEIGESVTPNTVVGSMYGGPYGIETGWAQSSADGDTMAAVYGQYYGGNTTAFGNNFSQLLTSLGAPGGVLQNPPTGYLPSGWPSW